MADELKPCPFCGSEDLYAGANNYWFEVRCRCCDCQSNGEDHPSAIAAWNRRPSGWIPVSERLPEREGRYLVTLLNREDGRLVVQEVWFYERGVWDKPVWQKAIAWQPLPEPYEAEGV